MVKSKKLRKVITGEQDFPTLEEYRVYLISTLTSLQEQDPVFEEDVLMPEEKIPVEETFRLHLRNTPEGNLKRTPVVKTRISEQEIQEELMQVVDGFQYKKFWLLNDSVSPSLLDLGLQNHPDAERPNYYQKQSKNKELRQNSSHSLNLRVENAMVDELYNSQECEKAICDPDEDLLLFPDTSKSEDFDDITTMKYLMKYKVNVGPLPFSVHEPEPTQTQLDCLHTYIEAHLIPWGKNISGVRLRSKILKLHNKYKNLVEGKGGKPNAQGFSTQVNKFMIDLLKKIWEQDQEAGANLGR